MKPTPVDPIHFEALYPENTREKETGKILQYVKSGNSCQIVGLPGVGRSNIFALLGYNKEARIKHLSENHKWFHFVYMDFSEVKGRALFDITKFILISLSYSLSERHLDEEQKKIKEFLKEGLEFNDELILFQALKKSIDYLSIDKQLTVVFLFDRFDAYLPGITSQFFTNLRILRNRAKYRFSSVFSLTRPLEEILEPLVFADFYDFLIENIVYLPLADAPLTHFRFSYLEKITGEKADAKIKREILTLTGGHGKLSRLCYEAVLSQELSEKNLEASLLEKNLIKGALYEIWGVLLPEEQEYIKTLIGTSRATESRNKFPYLEKVGLIQNNIIMIPLLVEFVKTLPQEVEKIKFDATKNEIHKGEENISDKLSPSEFRLLRYLILNEEKIIEKDEIIEAVWKDSKTQEGVTDQALDQIIYRLRKKIENDPNNPQHISTIKGRGYKFTA